MMEQAGMSSQHRGQGLPFFATTGSAMTGFKPNVKSQDTAQRQSSGSDPCRATSERAASLCGS